jgi:hypothetical protein
MKWYFVAIFALVAMVAGYFIHPYINPPVTVQAPTGLHIIDQGPTAPDTVVIDRYITVEQPIYVTKWKTRTKETIVIDTVYVEKEVPIFRSTEFFQDEYYSSMIWAWSKAPVDSFQNRVTIDYERYFYDVYSEKLRQERNRYRWTDLGIGVGVGVGITAIALVLIQ